MKPDTITTNFYEVLHKLEQFRKKINETSNPNEIEELICQLKIYIFSVNELKAVYTQRVNTFANILPSSDTSSEELEIFNPNKNFNKEFEDLYINVIAKNSVKEADYSRCISFLFYYPIILDYIDFNDYVRRFPTHTGIVSLYRNMNRTKLDTSFISKYKTVLEAIDFYLLKLFDMNYAFSFGEQPTFMLYSLGCNQIEKKFTLLFIKSVCNGVIHRLCIEISSNYITRYYNDNVQKSIASQNSLPDELINLSEQEKKVYLKFYKTPHITVKEVSKEMGVSCTRINNIIITCCSQLNLYGKNLTSLRDYINCHKY